jgi:hypothetical protein
MNTLTPLRFTRARPTARRPRREREESRFTCRTLSAQPYALFRPVSVYATDPAMGWRGR